MKIFLYLIAAVFGVIAAGFLIVAFTPFKVNLEHRDITSRRRYQAIGVAAGNAAVTVAALVGLAVGSAAPSASPLPSRLSASPLPSRPSESPSAQGNITFQEPQDGDRVLECLKAVEGYGQIPAGKGLWIIVVPDASEPPLEYWIESEAINDSPDHWITTSAVSISIADDSGVANIYAVLIDKQWSQYFSSSNADAMFHSSSLPPTDSPVTGPLTVIRIAEPSGKSCHSGAA
jgi:hypothetical protein